MLLSEVLQYDKSISDEERIVLLEQSVKQEVDWINNRLRMTYAYDKKIRYSEAVMQIKRAIENIPNQQFTDKIDLVDYYFEIAITGRKSHKIYEHLSEKLREYQIKCKNNNSLFKT